MITSACKEKKSALAFMPAVLYCPPSLPLRRARPLLLLAPLLPPQIRAQIYKQLLQIYNMVARWLGPSDGQTLRQSQRTTGCWLAGHACRRSLHGDGQLDGGGQDVPVALLHAPAGRESARGAGACQAGRPNAGGRAVQ